MTKTIRTKDRKRPKPLANRRGEDWALRDGARSSIGITRPIRVECYADRLAVISDRGPAGNKVIALGPRTAASIDTFVSAIWEQMEAWGMAGRGMYWRPVLQVFVAPGAERRFSDLDALLAGSGLTVQRNSVRVSAAVILMIEAGETSLTTGPSPAFRARGVRNPALSRFSGEGSKEPCHVPSPNMASRSTAIRSSTSWPAS